MNRNCPTCRALQPTSWWLFSATGSVPGGTARSDDLIAWVQLNKGNFAGTGSFIKSEVLSTIIVAAISTYFYRKTGTVWTGAFINALFITWYIVAGQAIQFAL